MRQDFHDLTYEEKLMDDYYMSSLKQKHAVHNEHVKLLEHYSELNTLELLKKCEFNAPFFLPCFMDNRGRQYYGTAISPTFNIIMRSLYEFAYTKHLNDSLYSSNYYKHIMMFEDCIKNYEIGNNKGKYVTIVLFIEVGKFFIKK